MDLRFLYVPAAVRTVTSVSVPLLLASGLAAGWADAATAQEGSGERLVEWTAPVRWEAGAGLLLAEPVGDFGRYVRGGGGFGLAAIRYFGEARKLGVRVELTLISYGKTTEAHSLLLNGTSIDVDVTTENSIGGFAVGPHYAFGWGAVRPYVGASVGSAQFVTTNSAWAGSGSVPIATAEVLERHALSLAAGGGMRLALWSRRRHPIALEFDLRYLRHGEVEYLREGGVRALPDGSVAFESLVTDANLWRIQVGAAVGFRSAPRPPGSDEGPEV